VRDGALSVWGATRHLPPYALVLEVAAPGLLVVKQYRGGEHTKFANIAVLEGDQVKIVDEQASSLPDCPPLCPLCSASTRRDRGPTPSTSWCSCRSRCARTNAAACCSWSPRIRTGGASRSCIRSRTG
jgi:hypothetical protein